MQDIIPRSPTACTQLTIINNTYTDCWWSCGYLFLLQPPHPTSFSVFQKIFIIARDCSNIMGLSIILYMKAVNRNTVINTTVKCNLSSTQHSPLSLSLLYNNVIKFWWILHLCWQTASQHQQVLLNIIWRENTFYFFLSGLQHTIMWEYYAPHLHCQHLVSQHNYNSTFLKELGLSFTLLFRFRRNILFISTLLKI